MESSFAKNYLDDALQSFRDYKELAEKALAQIGDAEFFVALDEEANSIAVIIKHISGNMRSRWVDFLTSDGEKSTRNRDAEFVITPETTKDALLAEWENGWKYLFAALEPLTADDFDKKIYIRGEAHSIIEALNRQLTHYAYHTGQIVFLAKHFKSAEWKTLSVPRNRSAEFNMYLSKKAESAEGEMRSGRFRSAQDFVRDVETEKP